MPHSLSAEELGIPLGTVVKVTKEGRSYRAVTSSGEDVTDKIQSFTLKNAIRANKSIQLEATKTGGTRWHQVALVEFDMAARKIGDADRERSTEQLMIAGRSLSEADSYSLESFKETISLAASIKPKKLRISDVWWRFAVRSAMRGQNLLVVGPSGCGKTLLANALKVALHREEKFYYVNLGSTQDPRSTLIGNTHYSPDSGTFVSLSYFANAIQVPNALILLDEVSRAHPEAENILMTVLDHTQRYLRVDEKADSETIRVAPGVAFVMTANVGSEYTATRTMDRALLDRCIMLEMSPLNADDEFENLKYTIPEVEDRFLKSIASIAGATRDEIKSDTAKIDTIISTRMAEEMAALIRDGFTLSESAEVCVYPYYTDAGGAESPRTYMRTLVQRFLPTEFDDKANAFGKSGSDFATKPKENDDDLPF